MMAFIKGFIKYSFIVLLVLAGWLVPEKSFATHLRAGQITVTRISCISSRFRITVTVYTDMGCDTQNNGTGGCILFGGSEDWLDFGDGTRQLVPETKNTNVEGDIGVASYSVIHDFPGASKYTISYTEPNRNEGVLNMANSLYTTFYIETQIDLRLVGCGNSPVLLIPPIDRACTGVSFYHNPGAYDPDGDSLSYELVVPFSSRGNEVVAYRPLNDPSFYADYAHGNEDGDGPPTFTINPVDGTIVWDAPSLPEGKTEGEFNIAFVVKEWRIIDGSWENIGFIRRDMQIIVEDCNNQRPELIVPDDICVVAGTSITDIVITGSDQDAGQNVKIEAFSEILATKFKSPATVTPFPAVYQNSPAELRFNWNTTCDHVKDQPYQVVFKITDNPSVGPKLVSFATWTIRVVAPPPQWQPPVLDVAKRHVKLKWDPYLCAVEANLMQIWRKVDATNFTPAECQTGMPENLGYTLIAQIPIKDDFNNPVDTYTDTNKGKGLDVGAQYCYRLVATFSSPRGGESYVSDEICIPPILADAPVVTNVTVDITSKTDGQITVRWTPPFDINTTQFPGPYEYVVQRANEATFTTVSPVTISDTSFVDTGLNTFDLTYTYRVILYSPTDINPIPQKIDTSAVASAVTLELNTEPQKIELSWFANVPWSNQLDGYPYHHIYRGPEGATVLSDLQLIDSLNVLEDGLIYIDSGQYNNIKLDNSTKYCYVVMTKGGYGNSKIKEPLKNFSQVNCAIPGDEKPPCSPVIQEIESLCDADFVSKYGCNPVDEFPIIIKWSSSGSDCADDAWSYNLYRDGFLYKSNLRDTLYEDSDYSLAHCYEVEAVDRSGNVSAKSAPVCSDNCPYYELPNVFTPGDGNGCNDLFSAYGATVNITNCDRVDELNKRCARFVLRVNFTAFNRWGKKVYSFEGTERDDSQEGTKSKSIYIKWDGRDSDGKDLPSGVYYYTAEVTYDVVNPSKQVQVMKGWIHLVRYSN